MLQPEKRLLFERLAVFAGHWSLAAAEAICSDEPLVLNAPSDQAVAPPHPDLTTADERPARYLSRCAVLDLLTALVDKSLGGAEPGGDVMHYRYLETIRHFARTRLVAAGEESRRRDRHLHYYLAFMEERKASQPGMPSSEWQAQIRPELDNLRAALI